MIELTLVLTTGEVVVEGDEIRLLPCNPEYGKFRVQVWNGPIKSWDINVQDIRNVRDVTDVQDITV